MCCPGSCTSLQAGLSKCSVRFASFIGLSLQLLALLTFSKCFLLSTKQQDLFFSSFYLTGVAETLLIFAAKTSFSV